MSRVETWWSARRKLAAMAVVGALATGALVAWVGGGGVHIVRAGLYTLVAVGALRSAPLVAGQVLVGLATIGGVLATAGFTGSLLLAPAVAGVILTAELLAAVARLDSPVERGMGDTVARATAAAGLGAAVFLLVLLPSGTSGLPGSVGLALAAAATLGLGVAIHRSASGSATEG